MTSFYDIVAKYSAVNHTGGTDKVTLHSYGETYNTIIDELKVREQEQKPIDILEIGIYSGAFVKVLSECLPSAYIDGMDIDLSHLRFNFSQNSNIRIFNMDGTRHQTVVKLGKTYDLIIDDGSHLPSDQLKTLDIFAPCLKNGGVYVLEDIQPQYADDLQKKLKACADQHGLSMEWRDLRGLKGRTDDILALFMRK